MGRTSSRSGTITQYDPERPKARWHLQYSDGGEPQGEWGRLLPGGNVWRTKGSRRGVLSVNGVPTAAGKARGENTKASGSSAGDEKEVKAAGPKGSGGDEGAGGDHAAAPKGSGGLMGAVEREGSKRELQASRTDAKPLRPRQAVGAAAPRGPLAAARPSRAAAAAAAKDRIARSAEQPGGESDDEVDTEDDKENEGPAEQLKVHLQQHDERAKEQSPPPPPQASSGQQEQVQEQPEQVPPPPPPQDLQPLMRGTAAVAAQHACESDGGVVRPSGDSLEGGAAATAVTAADAGKAAAGDGAAAGWSEYEMGREIEVPAKQATVPLQQHHQRADEQPPPPPPPASASPPQQKQVQAQLPPPPPPPEQVQQQQHPANGAAAEGAHQGGESMGGVGAAAGGSMEGGVEASAPAAAHSGETTAGEWAAAGEAAVARSRRADGAPAVPPAGHPQEVSPVQRATPGGSGSSGQQGGTSGGDGGNGRSGGQPEELVEQQGGGEEHVPQSVSLLGVKITVGWWLRQPCEELCQALVLLCWYLTSNTSFKAEAGEPQCEMLFVLLPRRAFAPIRRPRTGARARCARAP